MEFTLTERPCGCGFRDYALYLGNDFVAWFCDRGGRVSVGSDLYPDQVFVAGTIDDAKKKVENDFVSRSAS